MVPEQKLRKFYDCAKARGRDFPCMGHPLSWGFLFHTSQNQHTALRPPSFSPVFSALKTGKKEIERQKVSLEPHQAEKRLLVWFQWA